MSKKAEKNKMKPENKYPFDVDKVTEKFKNIKTLSDLTGSNGAIQELIKGTVERILKAEQENHLGYAPYEKSQKTTENARNGYSKKRVKTSSGNIDLEIPRDRDGTVIRRFLHES